MAHSPRSTLPKAEHDAKEQQSAMEALLLDAEQREERCTACGHERICSRRRPVICPSGVLLKGLSIPLCKNISLHPSGKSSLQIRAIPPHQRGVSRSSRTRGADAVDAAASCARWDRRATRKALERFPGVLTRDAFRVRQNRVVLTPRRWRQVR